MPTAVYWLQVGYCNWIFLLTSIDTLIMLYFSSVDQFDMQFFMCTEIQFKALSIFTFVHYKVTYYFPEEFLKKNALVPHMFQNATLISSMTNKDTITFPLFLLDFFPTFFFPKLAAHRKNVLMNEALIQCELLTALEIWGSNLFAAQVRYVEISPSDVPEAWAQPERVAGLWWHWEITGTPFLFFLMYNCSKDGLKCLSNKNWLFRPLYQRV